MGGGSSKPVFEDFHANTIEEAVNNLVLHLEDTRVRNQVIYFDGWDGLGASAVLNSVAEHPPPSLKDKFQTIIHIDCSRWKNRRALQRTIAQKLMLPRDVLAIFDSHDKEDDLVGIDEGSRSEIRVVGREIYRALQGQSSLVVFHNGSNAMVDFNDLGIPRAAADPWSNILRKVLWTFRGRLHAIKGRDELTSGLKPDKKQPEGTETVDTSYLCFGSLFSGSSDLSYRIEILREEATQIARYTRKHTVTREIAEICCKYLLSLSSMGNGILDFNWATHASNYWVCDGILDGFGQDKAWEVATALHKELRLKGQSCAHKFSYSNGDAASWTVTTSSSEDIVQAVQPETTSFFLAAKKEDGHSAVLLPRNMFQRSEQLHVLKLYKCTFSFSSPPFLCCPNLRFLGLDSCTDQQQKPLENKEELEDIPAMEEGAEEEEEVEGKDGPKMEEVEKGKDGPKMEEVEEGKDGPKMEEVEEGKDGPAMVEEVKEEKDGPTMEGKDKATYMEFFQSLWVLDICSTDWELKLSPDTTEKVATSIREISIKNGRIWHSNLAWRCLDNIHKLRVIKPTRAWQTGNMDDFTNMVKLELLDLSGNSTIKFLPSLSGAICLKILILDGCIGLEHIVPEILPASLETFSFDLGAHDKKAKISLISMAGCARLVTFRLRGSAQELEELDLSNTSIKKLDLSDGVVQVPRLQRVILLGCERLRAILWPKNGMPKLMVLRIDTRRGEAPNSKTLHDTFVNKEREEGCCAFFAVTEMRLLQWLVLANTNKFCWDSDSRYDLNLCLSSTSKHVGQNYNKEKKGPLQKSKIIPTTHRIYSDVNMDKAISERQFQPLERHVEISEGITYSNIVTVKELRAVILLMNRVYSLLVHDNSSISTVIPESMMSTETTKKMKIYWSCLRFCRVERCPNLDTVFATNYDITCFNDLEIFWASDLLMARCIWSKGRTVNIEDTESFAKLQAIHLNSCPRLTFVLPLSWFYTLSSLDTLHIVYCGALSQVFPVEEEFLNKICTDHPGGVLEFPMLKHIYLQELPKLQQICEAKIFAPKLKSITVRGCWSLKHLPATADRPNDRPVVDCEKDWWEKLEWYGKEASHHPSLFQPRHSKYYKKTLLRRTVLR